MMTDPLHLRITAIDTLMFRDGRPFNQADAGASEAVSVFPPYPPTLVGAVRAALFKIANVKKWDHVRAVLGDGTDWQDDKTLGPLRFSAPLLVRKTAESSTNKPVFKPLFPVPLHIVEGASGSQGVKPLTRLRPGEPRDCDLGSVRLPGAETVFEGIKPIEDCFVTLAGMEKILNGGLPEGKTSGAAGDLVAINDLWQTEPRVGIGIDPGSRTTTDGQLYMASHIRMAEDVSLQAVLEGYKGAALKKALMPLAGEHRMAEIGLCDEVSLPASSMAMEGGRYCAIQISPMVLDTMPRPGEPLGDLPGTLVSACLGKSVPIGGWDSQNRRPIPLRQAIPAGSVWFFDGADEPAFDWHGRSIGIGAAWGFGQLLIGTWNEGGANAR